MAVGAYAYQSTTEQRAADLVKIKITKVKQSKTKEMPNKGTIASANKTKTPGGYKFTPLVANQLS